MRVLIVGCGYVGLPLGQALAQQGHEVFGLRRSVPVATEMQAAGIVPLHADITRPESLKNLPRDFEWVINCAASGAGGVEDYRNIYLEGNRNLLAWLAHSPPKKFIYTSSTSVYGQNDGSVVTENSPAEPAEATSRILVQAEQLLLAAVAERRFPAVVLRVAGIYGPARGHWFNQFLRGDARIAGTGARWLNMIHRDDLIGVILAGLAGGTPGEIFNAADSEPVTQLQFFQWLAAELKQPLPAAVADAEVLRKRGGTNKRVSNAKLRTALKYEFQFPDFRAGYAAEIARLKTAGAPAI